MLQKLISLDQSLFDFMHNWARVLPEIWKFVAIYSIYVVPLFLLWYWFARRRELALFAFIAGVFAWQGVNNIISALVNRARPTPFIELNFPAHEFLFDRPGPSFPSDHTALLAALTTTFWLAGERRVAWFLLILSLITVTSRIVTAQHWPGDILVGALVGAGTAAAIWSIRRPIDRWIVQPLVGAARKIGL